MPTASVTKPEKPAPVDFFKQGLVIVEHKIRNLEKRKVRLEVYKETQNSGKELEKEQIAALEKYDEVVQLLEFSRDLSKQLNTVAQEVAKNSKKQARKEAQEKSQHELAMIKETLIIQEVLSSMGQEDIREDFLQGRTGVTLTPEELQQFDELYVELTPKRDESIPFNDQFQAASENMVLLLEGKPKPAFGTTYQVLKEKILEITKCGYFDKTAETTEAPVEVPEVVPSQEPQVTSVEKPLNPGFIASLQTEEPVKEAIQEAVEPAAPILPVAYQGNVVKEEPRPPQIEPPFYPPDHLKVFQSGVQIDFLQQDELEAPDVDSIPTLTYTNQSFNPLDNVPAAPQPEPPKPQFHEVPEDKEWKPMGPGGAGDAPNPTSDWIEPPSEDWVQQCDTWQQPPLNDGFIPAGGRVGSRVRGRGGGDKPKSGSRGRGGNNPGRGGHRGGDNGYYQNGYRERGDKPPRGGGRGQNSERPSGPRGGGRGGKGGTGNSGGFRGGNSGGNFRS